jgi:sarcosine oxidase
MDKNFQTIVVGLGAMGSAASYQLAKRGNKVLGIDQFFPPHIYGSSHGESRVTRQAIGEGEEYVPLVLRSYEIWKEIEKEAEKQVLTITGGLIMTSVDEAIHHGSHFFNQTVACAEKYGIAHHRLDANQIRKRFPQFKLRGNEKGYFEENAGYLRPELAIAAQLELAKRRGAHFAFNEQVLEISAMRENQVLVKTNKAEYEAEKVVLSAGPWVKQFLAERYARYFQIYRQVLYWFEVERSISMFEAPNLPIWIWEFGLTDEEIMYGFPAIHGVQGGVKIASEKYRNTTNPESVAREVSQQEIEEMSKRYIAPHFVGLSHKCIKAEICLYTNTPDFRFVIDTHPEIFQVIIASPCSGHGFKHSAAIGEVLAQLVTEGRSTIDISKFSFQRFD